ncbi:MAG: hypothetical protein KGL39_49460 [Patescibacteria group bacterium]|nr:hypothetical protein [Patescibacteria group bacterium]
MFLKMLCGCVKWSPRSGGHDVTVCPCGKPDSQHSGSYAPMSEEEVGRFLDAVGRVMAFSMASAVCLKHMEPLEPLARRL